MLTITQSAKNAPHFSIADPSRSVQSSIGWHMQRAQAQPIAQRLRLRSPCNVHRHAPGISHLQRLQRVPTFHWSRGSWWWSKRMSFVRMGSMFVSQRITKANTTIGKKRQVLNVFLLPTRQSTHNGSYQIPHDQIQ